MNITTEKVYLQRNIKMPKKLLKPIPSYDAAVLRYASDAYHFVVQEMELITLDQWANEIEKVCDAENPQTHEVCQLLRQYAKEE